MTLLARTRLIAILTIVVTVLLAAIFVQAQQRMARTHQADDSLDALFVEFSQMHQAAIDYSLRREERPRVQAEAKFKRLRTLLSDAWLATVTSDNPQEERPLRARVRETFDNCETVFGQISPTGDDPALQERDRRTRNLFLLSSQSLADAITALRPVIARASYAARWQTKIIGTTLAGMVVAMALLAAVLLERSILHPLNQLRQAADAIGNGDLTLRLRSQRTDELGVLAQAFDAMLDRLAVLTVSRAKLEAEIGERQRAEQEVHRLNAELEARVQQRTAELEAANKELEAFAYSVSHDLRAPLRAIDGFSRKVVIGYGEKLDAEGRRQLQVVRDNAQGMGKLIDDLLAFSRMGRREMAEQALDMEAMARGVANELCAAEPQRAIEFSCSPLPPAWGDAAMLRQVWVNLLANAVKFSRQRQVAHIEVGGRAEGGEVLYWVKDDGAGFDMQYADKLFGVFQRLHRQDEFEGTGVGLAIAQRILHRHNGRIWGQGMPDAGATFSFALPLPSADEHPSGGQAS